MFPNVYRHRPKSWLPNPKSCLQLEAYTNDAEVAQLWLGFNVDLD